MPKIKNVSPYGDLDVPLLGRVVKAGETVDVTTEQARVLLRQAENFAAPGSAAKKKAVPRKRAAKKAAPARGEAKPEQPAAAEKETAASEGSEQR